jgi:RNA exonuclease 1
MVIIDHGNPGAWHSTLVTAPMTTIAYANDAEVLNGLLGALDSHKCVFGRLMGLADALGCV